MEIVGRCLFVLFGIDGVALKFKVSGGFFFFLFCFFFLFFWVRLRMVVAVCWISWLVLG